LYVFFTYMVFLSTKTPKILTHALWTIKIEDHVRRKVGHSQPPPLKVPLDTKIPLSPQVGLPMSIGSCTWFRKY